jgi:hypothetical protein
LTKKTSKREDWNLVVKSLPEGNLSVIVLRNVWEDENEIISGHLLVLLKGD